MGFILLVSLRYRLVGSCTRCPVCREIDGREEARSRNREEQSDPFYNADRHVLGVFGIGGSRQLAQHKLAIWPSVIRDRLFSYSNRSWIIHNLVFSE